MLNTVVAKHDIKQMSFIGISIQIQLAMVGSVALFYSLPNFSAFSNDTQRKPVSWLTK